MDIMPWLEENGLNKDKKTDTGKEAVVKEAVKALIAMSSSAKEADKVVVDFNKKFQIDIDDTVEILKQKYKYVAKLFDVDCTQRATYSPPGSGEFDKAATDYYSLLSILILSKW
jgi:hypothetical protein